MKLAITSPDGKFGTPLSPGFGRCKFFIIIDTDTRNWVAKPNPASIAQDGAGPEAVKFLTENDVEATVSWRYGPDALTSLETAGIQAFEANEGAPEDLLEQCLAGKLKKINA